MGLGKTVMMLALIHTNSPPYLPIQKHNKPNRQLSSRLDKYFNVVGKEDETEEEKGETAANVDKVREI